MRPTFIAHSNATPPESQRSLRTRGPRTAAAKTEPIRRNPTTPFTPEQADATLRANVVPWWLTTRSWPSSESAGFARWARTEIFSTITSVRSVKALSTPRSALSNG